MSLSSWPQNYSFELAPKTSEQGNKFGGRVVFWKRAKLGNWNMRIENLVLPVEQVTKL